MLDRQDLTQLFRMAMLSTEEISRRLSDTLDCLGYSPQLVQLRKNYYNFMDRVLTFLTFGLRLRTVGSKREGMVKVAESDTDVLFFLQDVLVIEDNINTQFVPESVTVLTMVPCLLHPGHFKLSLERQGTRERIPTSCFNPCERGYLLSRKEFIMKYNTNVIGSISGPARTILFTVFGMSVSFDNVYTFPCVCPNILHQWLQRPRRYDWPPSELRQRISRMTGNIVATGQKGCPDEEIEWRLCFNEIELLILDTWNDTQRKLYKVLKMIKKDVLVKAGFDISSYMMKNTVLWLSETYPQSNFRSEKLFFWVIKSLKLLRKAVKVYNLPYYMIFERNLIAERVPRCQQKKLMKEISHLIHRGPQLLWECERLEFAMSMTLNELRYYSERIEVNYMRVLICLPHILATHGVQGVFEQLKKSLSFLLLLNSLWPQDVEKCLNYFR